MSWNRSTTNGTQVWTRPAFLINFANGFVRCLTNLPSLSRPQVKSVAAWSPAATVEKNCLLAKASFSSDRRSAVPPYCAPRAYASCICLPSKNGANRGAIFPLNTFLLSYFGGFFIFHLWPADRLALPSTRPSLGTDWRLLWSAFPFGRRPFRWPGRRARPTARALGCRGCSGGSIGWPRAPAVPDSTEVLVMTDRGLYSKELFEAIIEEGGHPLLRIPRVGYFRPEGARGKQKWRPVSRLLPRPGLCYRGRVEMFRTPSKRLECTLLAGWTVEQDAPWILLTDLIYPRDYRRGSQGRAGGRPVALATQLSGSTSRQMPSRNGHGIRPARASLLPTNRILRSAGLKGPEVPSGSSANSKKEATPDPCDLSPGGLASGGQNPIPVRH